jgi:hypothetical protein
VKSVLESPRLKPRLTRKQVRGFWAAWGGWTMDGMDSFIYSLVLVPALREVPPRSGIPAATANIGYYGGLLFALFMIGWGMALVELPLLDRVANWIVGGSVYVPAEMTYIAARSGRTAMEAARLASYSTGSRNRDGSWALIVPLLAEWLGRRITLGIFVALMFFSIFLAFGHVFYMQEGAVGCSWSPPSFSG